MHLIKALAGILVLLVSGLTSPAPANPIGVFSVLDYGAVGDAKAKDTAALQKAIDACAAQGGGQVLLPGGKTYLCGSLTLRSNVDFHLASGAVLKGSPDWRDYLPTGALLFAKDSTRVLLSGDGAVDGNDHAIWQKLADEEAGGDVNKPDWWPQSFIGDYWPFGKLPGAPDKTGGRPMMVIFVGCDQVRLRDLTLRAAPSWTVHLVGCEDVAVTAITIHNAWDVPNNDGIDVDHCRGVRIADCFIESADDCIVIKNTPNFATYGDCEHITVTGCTVASRSAALKVDEVYTGAARDIVFADCVVSHSNRGLCIQSRDDSVIENVEFSNIVVQTEFSPHKWWGAAEPIHVTHYPRTAQTKLGHVRNIRFSNLLLRGENGLVFVGWEGSPLEDVVLDNVRLELVRAPAGTGGFYDMRPAGLYKGVFESALAGVYLRHARGFVIRNSRIAWAKEGAAGYGKAIDQEAAGDLKMEGVEVGP